VLSIGLKRLKTIITKKHSQNVQRHNQRFLRLPGAEDGEQEQEDVDDVNVEVQRAVDVFFLTELVPLSSHDQLSVEGEELPTSRDGKDCPGVVKITEDDRKFSYCNGWSICLDKKRPCADTPAGGRRIGVTRGSLRSHAPQIFRTYSYFVVSEAVSQTK